MAKAGIQSDKSKEIKNTLDSLIENYCENPEEIAELLAFKSKFYRYSMNNAALIRSQNPYATFVASYDDWKEKGYQVQRGQHGIKIIFPIRTEIFEVGEKDGKKQYRRVTSATQEEKEMIEKGVIKPFSTTRFGVGNVFDISQTDCPTEDYPKFYQMGYSSDRHALLYDTVKQYAVHKGIFVDEVDLQSIALRGLFSPMENGIRISDKLNDTEKLSTLTHELGHALLHSDSSSQNKNLSIIELEADCVSIMLQQELGIELTDSRKKHFVQHYNICNGIENFKLEDVLKNVNLAYFNLRNELDPIIEQAIEDAGKEELINRELNNSVNQCEERKYEEIDITQLYKGYDLGNHLHHKDALYLLHMGVPVGSISVLDSQGNRIGKYDEPTGDLRTMYLPIKTEEELIKHDTEIHFESLTIHPDFMNIKQMQQYMYVMQMLTDKGLFTLDEINSFETTFIKEKPFYYEKMIGMRDKFITEEKIQQWVDLGGGGSEFSKRVHDFIGVDQPTDKKKREEKQPVAVELPQTIPDKPIVSNRNKQRQPQPDYKEQDGAVLDYIKRGVSILRVAEDMGFTAQQIGGYYTLKEHDSVRIYPDTNSFHRFSADVGGSNIDFAMHFGGLTEKEAIRSLKEKYVGDRMDSLPQYTPPAQTTPEPKKFELPQKAEGKFSRAYAYLTKTRCLDSEIVQSCMKDGLIYEDNKHNVVFVGKDAEGTTAYATRHTTLTDSDFKRDVAGSRQDIGFMVDHKATRLYVTEAPIDALSIMCLRKQQGHDIKDANYMATCGTGKDAALYYRLRTNPHIKEVILANDNDEAGQAASRKIFQTLKKEFPEIKISCLKIKGKDVNEQLKNRPKNPKKKITQEVER